MARLILKSGGTRKVYDLTKDVTFIGRSDSNEISIPHSKVSREHSQIHCKGEEFLISDLDSANGTFVNGKKITKNWELKNGDEIGIGDFTLIFEMIPSAEKRPIIEEKAPPKGMGRTEREQVLADLTFRVHEALLERLDLRNLDISQVDEKELRRTTKEMANEIIVEMASEIPRWVNRKELLKAILDEALGLGPIQDLLSEPEITEIMVNKPDQVYIERDGKLELTGKRFFDDEHILRVIRRIVAPIGRKIDESTPMVDARLKDGSRVNAIISPLALQGPTLTVRRFSVEPFTLKDLLSFGSLTSEIAKFLEVCVQIRKNIIVSGGTGSGKTTLLNFLSSYIPEGERIITIEDSAELKLRQTHIVSLEARPPNIEGKGAIPIRELVRNALRMRPNRIVVGECRGGEALDMLQAMNTGHDGSLTTAHANSPRDVLSRLETMVLMSGIELPVRAIRQQIASAINIIVQTSRFNDGSRKVTHISEITGLNGDNIEMRDLFLFKQTGLDKEGKVLGKFVPTGIVPEFIEGLEIQGIHFPKEIFKRQEELPKSATA